MAYGYKTGGGSRRGKPNEVTQAMRDLARPYVPLALGTIVGLARRGESQAIRLAASKEILNRCFGKPGRQEGTAPDRLTLNTQINNFGQQQGPLSASDAYAEMCRNDSIVDVSTLLPLNAGQQESRR